MQRTIISQYAPAKAAAGKVIPDDVYDATVLSVELIRDLASKEVALNEKGQPAVWITVELDYQGEDDQPVTLRRRANVTYGLIPNTKKGGVFAEFVYAALGIPPGDKRQQAVAIEDFPGKRLRVTTEQAESKSNGKVYSNIASFMRPRQPAPPLAAKEFADDADGDIPF